VDSSSEASASLARALLPMLITLRQHRQRVFVTADVSKSRPQLGHSTLVMGTSIAQKRPVGRPLDEAAAGLTTQNHR